jgi:hypothetical protein
LTNGSFAKGTSGISTAIGLLGSKSPAGHIYQKWLDFIWEKEQIRGNKKYGPLVLQVVGARLSRSD